MSGKILILGASGNFGKRIAQSLADGGFSVILAGRNAEKLNALAAQLPPGSTETACFDIHTDLDSNLARLRPAVLINTCGPFQSADYAVAETAIAQHINYIDLADGRDFVTGITQLDAAARRANVAVISGASTVPGLSSAVLDHFAPEFSKIEDLTFGISPGQKAERGRATTQGILSYVGKPLNPFPSHKTTVYGWQDLYRQDYGPLGKRWMANCDIPDLDLLPARYRIDRIRFSAGLELGILHLGLWGLSWLVRWGAPLNLPHHANTLLNASNWFNRLGSADGGMHMIISGKDTNGTPLSRTWKIIAFNGDGPHIPTIPAIVLAKKMVQGAFSQTGAMPCLGLVTLDEYLTELKPYAIQTLIE